ncbi:BREX-1 system adenine-specific DNA-methyltransferase PglX [Halobacillus litoralis]|uniref:Eco57I restriction-modification methylase domain-containing protein n=1 Tax=Halobacillus litoralis TaxID=45668 RepID=UPI001CD7C7EF|nr:N-6 DNA methylase [Halobacillus litoralis]MCA0971175.1 BREX-1 system adenine-specific DNA-methyltransferase PglX [Halobacillus litoralis]
MLSPQRAMGQYSTPQETVDYMVNTVSRHLESQHEEPQILDPSTGDGIFVRTLVQSGYTPSQIHAYDVDPAIPAQYEGIHYAHQDFLKAEGTNRFDAIIGNPPYKSKRQSSYFTENRDVLAEQFQDIGVHNMYSLFIYKGLQLLKEGGILTMIVQDSFLTNVYYKHFRNYLLNHSEIQEVILAPRRLFHHGKADVRTSILTIKKAPAKDGHTVRLVDRLTYQQYENPPETSVQYLPQTVFKKLPNYNFAINVPEEVLELFRSHYKPLEHIVPIKTGVSTGNDGRFLRKADEITDAEDWIPFYKNGGAKDGWYYPPKHYIHKDWRSLSQNEKKFTIRNPSYLYQEGITCSSMGVKFSASYLPKGSLFGVNANLFPDKQEDLYYLLGLLNSSLVKYILRKVLNRTNMVTSGYIKKIPYIRPSEEQKSIVVKKAETLVEKKKENPEYSTEQLHQEIDDIIFDVYRIKEEHREEMLHFCENVLECL